MPLPLSYSVRSLFARRLRTALTVAVIALVVVACTLFLGLVSSLQRTLVATGHERNLIVMRKGSSNDGSIQLPLEDLHEVALHENHRRELVVGVHLELHVISTREAIVAAVCAAPIGIEGPVEWHALNAIERRPAGDFLIARLVGASLGFGQRLDATFLDQSGDLARGRLAGAEVE